MNANTTISLRIPRGLWQDLEETVIRQERQFLSEVARSLGLPPQEVIRRCLGTGGTSHAIPVLWTPPTTIEPEACPWWECHGEGLWRRCPRLRIANTLPCSIHERCTPCPMARLDSDPVIRKLGWRIPIICKDQLYWVDPKGDAAPFNEDGTVATEYRFHQIHTPDGTMAWARERLA